MSDNIAMITSLKSERPEVSKNQAIELAAKLFGLHVSDHSTVKELDSYYDRNFYVRGWLHHDEVDQEKEYILRVLNQIDSAHDSLLDAQCDAMLFLKAKGHQCPTPILSILNTPYIMCKFSRDGNSGHIGLENGSTKGVDSTHFKDTCNNESCSKPLNPNTQPGLMNGIEIYYGKGYSTKDYYVCAVCLLAYLPGKLLSEVPLTTELLFDIGKSLGRLDQDFKVFEFPTLVRPGFLWDLSNFCGTIEVGLEAIACGSHNKQLVQEVCSCFREDVLPKINVLPKQIIHGDINDNNTIVDVRGKFRGFIDFGDLNYTCRVYDIAIALMYAINMEVDIPSSERINRAGVVFAGYQSVNPLSEVEIDLLYLLTAARFCQSLVFGAYTYKYMDPGNEYLLNTSEHGWKNFEAFWKTPKETVLNTWLQINAELKNMEEKEP